MFFIDLTLRSDGCVNGIPISWHFYQGITLQAVANEPNRSIVGGHISPQIHIVAYCWP